jgi:hypothetical protein
VAASKLAVWAPALAAAICAAVPVAAVATGRCGTARPSAGSGTATTGRRRPEALGKHFVSELVYMNKCCGSRMFNPGSGSLTFFIPDPGG